MNRRWRQALLALLLAGAGSAPVLAQSPPSPLTVEIGELGVAEAGADGGPSLPPTGDNLVGSSHHVSRGFSRPGNAVDAHYCDLFGFRFRAPNMPRPLAMRVTVQMDHPLWTRPDGRTGTREEYPGVLSQDWTGVDYALEESWTLVPGTWRFTIRLGDMVLATQSFELTVDPGQSLPPDGCATPTS